MKTRWPLGAPGSPGPEAAGKATEARVSEARAARGGAKGARAPVTTAPESAGAFALTGWVTGCSREKKKRKKEKKKKKGIIQDVKSIMKKK